jgi:hypothetical protein
MSQALGKFKKLIYCPLFSGKTLEKARTHKKENLYQHNGKTCCSAIHSLILFDELKKLLLQNIQQL